MHKSLLTLALGLLLFTGCASNRNVIVATGTVLGFDISESPQTGLYHAKFGYARTEFALVPSTNGYTPDVLMELRFHGMLSKEGGLYQRVAVGTTAVSQPGAAVMFLKNSSGQLDTNAVAALKAFSSVPTPMYKAPTSLITTANAYRISTNKPAWDVVAQKHGYASFRDFLIDPALTAESVDSMNADLKAANLL
jgi:hypothetical protein